MNGQNISLEEALSKFPEDIAIVSDITQKDTIEYCDVVTYLKKFQVLLTGIATKDRSVIQIVFAPVSKNRKDIRQVIAKFIDGHWKFEIVLSDVQ